MNYEQLISSEQLAAFSQKFGVPVELKSIKVHNRKLDVPLVKITSLDISFFYTIGSLLESGITGDTYADEGIILIPYRWNITRQSQLIVHNARGSNDPVFDSLNDFLKLVKDVPDTEGWPMSKRYLDYNIQVSTEDPRKLEVRWMPKFYTVDWGDPVINDSQWSPESRWVLDCLKTIPGIRVRIPLNIGLTRNAALIIESDNPLVKLMNPPETMLVQHMEHSEGRHLYHYYER